MGSARPTEQVLLTGWDHETNRPPLAASHLCVIQGPVWCQPLSAQRVVGPRPARHHVDIRPYGQAKCQEGDGGHQFMRRLLARWERSPQASSQPYLPLDNSVLVPASELSALAEWQRWAQRLPAGAMLLVLPRNNPRIYGVGRRICWSLEQRGRRSYVATVGPR